MTRVTLKGSCLCGSVRYEISGELLRFYHCHCQRCRKTTSTGHATNLMVKTESFNWIHGAELLKRYKVPDAERFYTHFCSQCGSGMPRDVPEIGAFVIPAGTVDSDIPMQPQARIFWDSRSEWSCDGSELPVYSKYP